ncbi:MAG: hypothetical protein JRH10_11705 [Deltaproteobacteria bacterium]|nr:hypothetical protein [Deltaproteobacteria bacterium]MBW2444507.1 hypothetical protein [Deltaproteobacteria bacterium]
MSEATVRELVEGWSSAYAGLDQAEIDQRVLGFTALVRAIAERGGARPADLAKAMGISADAAREAFEGLAAVGLQVDAEGRVVGAALTTEATPHRVRIEAGDRYAWCALDTLFIPGLLRETAEIESTCPESGESIRLTVAPDRFQALEPEGAFVSIVDPRALANRQVGPASPT